MAFVAGGLLLVLGAALTFTLTRSSIGDESDSAQLTPSLKPNEIVMYAAPKTITTSVFAAFRCRPGAVGYRGATSITQLR